MYGNIIHQVPTARSTVCIYLIRDADCCVTCCTCIHNRPLRGCTETDDVTLEIQPGLVTDWRGRADGQSMDLRVMWTDYDLALVYWCSHVTVRYTHYMFVAQIHALS